MTALTAILIAAFAILLVGVLAMALVMDAKADRKPDPDDFWGGGGAL